MPGFHTKTFNNDDEYMTPFYAWKNIEKYLPKNKIIWEAFYGDGTSKKNLNFLGCDRVIHEPMDFYKSNVGECIVSNPPYHDKVKVFKRLILLDKPFILLLPDYVLASVGFRNLFKDKNIQIIIPRSRIHFNRKKKRNDGKKDRCNFDCFYYCYKMNLPKDIIFLDDDENSKQKYI